MYEDMTNEHGVISSEKKNKSREKKKGEGVKKLERVACDTIRTNVTNCDSCH